MKTRIHFEVLNLSKMVLNYRKNLYYYSRLNFILQNAVMGTKYRSGFHSIFDLRINLDMISQVPVGGALPKPITVRKHASNMTICVLYRFTVVVSEGINKSLNL